MAFAKCGSIATSMKVAIVDTRSLATQEKPDKLTDLACHATAMERAPTSLASWDLLVT